MKNRYTSPPLLWSLAQDYAARHWPDHPAGPADLRLYVYAEGGGAWLMHGPARLYWQDEPDPSAPFSSAPADALAGADIADVVLIHLRLRQSSRWDSLDAAVEGMRPRIGRPPKSGETMDDEVHLRFPAAWRKSMTGDAGDWIRQAIAERIERLTK